MNIQSPCYFIVGDFNFPTSDLPLSVILSPRMDVAPSPSHYSAGHFPKTTPKGLEPHNINGYGPRLKKLKLNNSNNLMRITHWIP